MLILFNAFFHNNLEGTSVDVGEILVVARRKGKSDANEGGEVGDKKIAIVEKVLQSLSVCVSGVFVGVHLYDLFYDCNPTLLVIRRGHKKSDSTNQCIFSLKNQESTSVDHMVGGKKIVTDTKVHKSRS